MQFIDIVKQPRAKREQLRKEFFNDLIRLEKGMDFKALEDKIKFQSLDSLNAIFAEIKAGIHLSYHIVQVIEQSISMKKRQTPLVARTVLAKDWAIYQAEINQNPEDGCIYYKQTPSSAKQYKMISIDMDFVSDQTRYITSLGGAKSRDREIVLFDRQGILLKQIQFEIKTPSKYQSIRGILETTARRIHQQSTWRWSEHTVDNKLKDFVSRQASSFGAEPIPVQMETLISEGLLVCRHKSLMAADTIAFLVNKNRLPNGLARQYRSNLMNSADQSTGLHAWSLYRNLTTGELWMCDPRWQKVYNLSHSGELSQARSAYGKPVIDLMIERTNRQDNLAVLQQQLSKTIGKSYQVTLHSGNEALKGAAHVRIKANTCDLDLLKITLNQLKMPFNESIKSKSPFISIDPEALELSGNPNFYRLWDPKCANSFAKLLQLNSKLATWLKEYGFNIGALNKVSTNPPGKAESQHTPLTFALVQKRYDLIPELLKLGANINQPNQKKWPVNPLQWLATWSEDDLKGLNYLLTQPGIDKNIMDSRFGYTPLMWAAYSGYSKILSTLLKLSVAEKMPFDFNKVFSIAKKYKHKDAMNILFNHWLDTHGFNSKDLNKKTTFLKKINPEYQHTPLTFALVEKNYELFSELLQRGASLSIENSKWWPMNPLNWIATWSGDDLQALNMIIPQLKPTQINQPDSKFGYTPLMWAAHSGSCKIFACLKAHPEANLNVKSKDGLTALNIAHRRGNTAIADLILNQWLNQHGFSTKYLNSVSKNIKGPEALHTPLTYALVEGKLDIVEYLLSKGADVTQANQKRWPMTPLSWIAAWSKDNDEALDAILKLPKTKHNLCQTDPKYGYTPLMWAAWSGYQKVAEKLLAELRKNKELTKKDKKQAKEIAQSKNHRNLALMF